MSKYVNLIEVIVREGEYTLPEGTDTWGIKSVKPDLKTKYGFQWPFPGGVCDQSEKWNPANLDVCPSRPGDGVCTGLNWWGMASGNIPARTLLLTAHDSETALTGIDKVRAPYIHVVALIDSERLIRKHGAHADLHGANLRLIDLWGAKLHGAYLQFADLSGADLRDTNLSDTNLRNAKLYVANLRGADLRDADLRDANLWGADLSGADLSDADLRDTNLWDANLLSAKLLSADLRGADLRDADLRDTDLRGADLSGADLSEARLGEDYGRGSLRASRTNLVGAKLAGAIMPDGYVYNPERHDKKYEIKPCV